jgi:V8-like Glu-specific endopeptidase
MRRILLPAILLVAALVAGCGGSSKPKPAVAGSAQAIAPPEDTQVVSGGPAGGAQGQDAAEYWTAERMRNAKPVDLIEKHGLPKLSRRIPGPEGPHRLFRPTGPSGGASSRPVSNGRTSFRLGQARGYPFPYSRYRWSGPTADLPARTWGKIFFLAPEGEYVCSGTAITSQNKSVVWTAGHCAANGGARFFYSDRWIFVPGYDNGKAPFGKFVGKKFFTTKPWYNRGNSAYDLAAVVVAPVKGKTLVDTVGGQGIAFNQPRTQEYYSGGYPADYPFDGESLWVCDAPLGNNDRAELPPTIAIGCDMTGGSSGGGWLVNVQNGLGTLVSVNSYGYYSQPDAMYGPYQSTTAQKLYEQASTYGR